jgi:hypothetical protein
MEESTTDLARSEGIARFAGHPTFERAIAEGLAKLGK